MIITKKKIMKKLFIDGCPGVIRCNFGVICIAYQYRGHRNWEAISNQFWFYHDRICCTAPPEARWKNRKDQRFNKTVKMIAKTQRCQRNIWLYEKFQRLYWYGRLGSCSCTPRILPQDTSLIVGTFVARVELASILPGLRIHQAVPTEDNTRVT